MANSTKMPFYFTVDEIMKAYNDCARNKKNTANAIRFGIDKIDNLIELGKEIDNMSYEIGQSIAFIVTYPVLREVFAADFRDRIVHHLVINELLPYFEAEFINESFACREGKGVLYGVDTMYNKIKEYTENYTKDAWILKMDIKSFFMSINKSLLNNMIGDFITEKYPNNRKKEALLWLCDKIIMHHPEKNCRKQGNLNLWDKLPEGKSLFDVGETHGLPIGNLTSQIFANYYMNTMDKYIKETLGFEVYGRYVDDFIIVSHDKKKLKEAIPQIEKFVHDTLGLTVHRKKRYLQHYTKGVQFIGAILKPNRRYVINRTHGNLFYKIKKKFKHYSKDKEQDFMLCLNSSLGYMSHYSTYKIRKKILSDKELMKEWLPHINISKNYKKVTLKDKKKNNDRISIIDDLPFLPDILCHSGN